LLRQSRPGSRDWLSAGSSAEVSGRSGIVNTFLVTLLEEGGELFLADSVYPSHYTAPEFFLEPAFRERASTSTQRFTSLAYVEWGCREGLAGTIFFTQIWGELVQTHRYRLDMSMFRRHAPEDWLTEKVEMLRPRIPEHVLTVGRSLRIRPETPQS
jgi:hypothetical protein